MSELLSELDEQINIDKELIQVSPKNGIKAIQDSGLAMHISRILIHDAARPLVSKEIIQANIDAFKKKKKSESLGVVTSIKATDTIVQSNDHEYVLHGLGQLLFYVLYLLIFQF